MKYLDTPFYHYFIGREDQSVQEQVMIRRINQQLRVNWLMFEQVDLDKVALFKVTEGLGLGMGGMNGTCGAISAAAVAGGAEG